MAPRSISSVSGQVKTSNGRVGKTGFLPHRHEESEQPELVRLVRWFREVAGE